MKNLVLGLGILFAAIASPVFASPALTITSGDDRQVLDRDQLERFPQVTVTTESPYFEGETTFSGPALERLVESVDSEGAAQITLSALNDYSVNASLQEVLEMGAIIATRLEGQVMSVRNRGPFWVILPLSERPDLDHEDYHRLMVWQLSGIELQ